MALIDNFNSYSNGDLNNQGGWSGSTTFNVVTTGTPYEGVKHIDVAGNAVYISKSISSFADGSISIWARTDTNAYGGCRLRFRLKSGATTAHAVFLRHDNGGEYGYITNGGSTFNIVGAGIGNNIYHKLECQFRSSDKNGRVRLNDGTWSSWFTATNTYSGSIDSIEVYAEQQTNAPGLKFDYIEYLLTSDNNGSANITLPTIIVDTGSDGAILTLPKLTVVGYHEQSGNFAQLSPPIINVSADELTGEISNLSISLSAISLQAKTPPTVTSDITMTEFEVDSTSYSVPVVRGLGLVPVFYINGGLLRGNVCKVAGAIPLFTASSEAGHIGVMSFEELIVNGACFVGCVGLSGFKLNLLKGAAWVLHSPVVAGSCNVSLMVIRGAALAGNFGAVDVETLRQELFSFGSVSYSSGAIELPLVRFNNSCLVGRTIDISIDNTVLIKLAGNIYENIVYTGNVEIPLLETILMAIKDNWYVLI